MPGDKTYLLLGNSIGYGTYQLELFSLILALKLKYPKQFYLIRGMHETVDSAYVYGLKDALGNKKTFMELAKVFEVLPIAAVVNSSIFCVSSGLSEEDTTLE